MEWPKPNPSPQGDWNQTTEQPHGEGDSREEPPLAVWTAVWRRGTAIWGTLISLGRLNLRIREHRVFRLEARKRDPLAENESDSLCITTARQGRSRRLGVQLARAVVVSVEVDHWNHRSQVSGNAHIEGAPPEALNAVERTEVPALGKVEEDHPWTVFETHDLTLDPTNTGLEIVDALPGGHGRTAKHLLDRLAWVGGRTLDGRLVSRREIATATVARWQAFGGVGWVLGKRTTAKDRKDQGKGSSGGRRKRHRFSDDQASLL
jgi:hypothetical protein